MKQKLVISVQHKMIGIKLLPIHSISLYVVPNSEDKRYSTSSSSHGEVFLLLTVKITV